MPKMNYCRFLSVLFVSILLSSCAIRSPYVMSISLMGGYKEHRAEEILIATYEAYKRLRECAALKRHASEYIKIVRLQQKVVIKLVTHSEVLEVRKDSGGEFCGFVRVGDKHTLYLNPYTFGNDAQCDYVETIGHEMLHLGDFHHRNPTESEAFYELIYECGL